MKLNVKAYALTFGLLGEFGAFHRRKGVHNLRASRETDFSHRFPIHFVTAWLGNSPRVAADHYLTVREQDFAAAIPIQGGAGRGGAANARNG